MTARDLLRERATADLQALEPAVLFDSYDTHYRHSLIVGAAATHSAATNTTRYSSEVDYPVAAEMSYRGATGQLSAEQQTQYGEAIKEFRKASTVEVHARGGQAEASSTNTTGASKRVCTWSIGNTDLCLRGRFGRPGLSDPTAIDEGWSGNGFCVGSSDHLKRTIACVRRVQGCDHKTGDVRSWNRAGHPLRAFRDENVSRRRVVIHPAGTDDNVIKAGFTECLLGPLFLSDCPTKDDQPGPERHSFTGVTNPDGTLENEGSDALVDGRFDEVQDSVPVNDTARPGQSSSQTRACSEQNSVAAFDGAPCVFGVQ